MLAAVVAGRFASRVTRRGCATAGVTGHRSTAETQNAGAVAVVIPVVHVGHHSSVTQLEKSRPPPRAHDPGARRSGPIADALATHGRDVGSSFAVAIVRPP